ncbi:hypothetical protein [Campylobacter jejuni]|uniref:hypothetical protein n=1 Tax=Campylobacter jejuni TaxID=197 RepID=UPI000F80E21F|nr:hypothetical protein [Campylobacter jejuni]RTI90442.1 hypothetical protein C3I00_08075 [Campylobacter jejuni]
MLKKLVNCLILGSLFTSSAFAGDFLAKVSNGALSDNSQGVKALNLDEMKQVKGGAISQDSRIIPLLGVLGVSSLSYLNAPTIGGPIYSGQVAPLGRPIRPL